MTTKHLLYLAFIVSAVATAQDKPGTEPPELAARRQEFLLSMERVKAPVFTTYLRTLEALKAQLTRDSKLEGALAVENEIKKTTENLDTANKFIRNPQLKVMPINIISATYGAPEVNRVVEVTKRIRDAYEPVTPTSSSTITK